MCIEDEDVVREQSNSLLGNISAELVLNNSNNVANTGISKSVFDDQNTKREIVGLDDYLEYYNVVY